MIKNIKQCTQLKNKTVLMRVDFNVSLKKDGKISDDKRIRAAIPTIRYLMSKGAKIVLMSHLGRPKEAFDKKYAMDEVAKRLSKLLEKDVTKLNACVGDDVKTTIASMKPKDIVLLENLRFYPEEKKNDAKFAKQLASFADIYVNDAFGVCHRKDASVAAITKYLDSYCGMLVQKEIDHLHLEHSKKPFVAILGGAKVSDKVKLIEKMLKKVDTILLGGAMIFTFYKAMGYETGQSIVEDDALDVAKKLLKKSKGKLILPVDILVADKIDAKASSRVYTYNVMPKKGYGLDIGPETILIFEEILKKAKTVFWNGPLGMFELKPFSKGTFGVAKTLATCKAVTVVGGGDSATAVNQLKLEEKFTHVSTGGGASIALIEGQKLPALVALDKKSN